jgi:hypothetical protein
MTIPDDLPSGVIAAILLVLGRKESDPDQGTIRDVAALKIGSAIGRGETCHARTYACPCAKRANWRPGGA